jgi:hypothetical protein
VNFFPIFNYLFSDDCAAMFNALLTVLQTLPNYQVQFYNNYLQVTDGKFTNGVRFSQIMAHFSTDVL